MPRSRHSRMPLDAAFRSDSDVPARRPRLIVSKRHSGQAQEKDVNVATDGGGPDFAHRRVRATLRLIGGDDAPLCGAVASVEQVTHTFQFGNIGFDFVGLANGETEPAQDGSTRRASPSLVPRLVEPFFDLFNAVTLPFYWRDFEPERGDPDTTRLLRAAQWFRDRGCTVKGHPLVWHTLAPRWLLDLTPWEVEEALKGRISREVTSFADVIATWDAINEAVIMPVFEKEANAISALAQRLGRVGMVRLAFETARAANPTATLILNDFDMSEHYERLIQACLDDGIAIDGIGLQSHMHQGYWGEAKTQAVLERFARFGLPLHMSETSLVSGQLMPPEIIDLNDYGVAEWPSTREGEERQADEVVRHYTTLVGHPAVRSITYWGLSDNGSWLGAPSGLVRVDGTPKPAFHALRRLVKGEWWLPATTVTTDDEGRIEVDAFAGRFLVRVGDDEAIVDLGTPGTVERDVAIG
jgi:endo-1,4-beta-xylanase